MAADHDPRSIASRARPQAVQVRILALVLAAAGLWVAPAFILQIVFAAILVTAVWPLYRRLARGGTRAERKVFLPLAFTLAAALILLIPLAILGTEVVNDSEAIGRWLATAGRTGVPAPPWLGRVPIAGHWLGWWWLHHLQDPAGARALFGRVEANSVPQWLSALAGSLLSWAMFLFVTLLAFFVLLRAGERTSDTVRRLAERFYGEFGERFVGRLAEAVRGIVNGTLLVSFGEGLLIGLGYTAAGLPHPLSFTTATIGFALVPFGAWVAFGAASAVLVATGNPLAAALLFTYSSAVMLIGDNLVQPALIGNMIRLPFLWTFVGIFGGMYSFGVVGLFIGPAVMAALFLAWCEWQGIDLPRGHRKRTKPA